MGNAVCGNDKFIVGLAAAHEDQDNQEEQVRIENSEEEMNEESLDNEMPNLIERNDKVKPHMYLRVWMQQWST